MSPYILALMLALMSWGDLRVTVPTAGGGRYIISHGRVTTVEPTGPDRPPAEPRIPRLHLGTAPISEPHVYMPRIPRRVVHRAVNVRPIVHIEPCPPGARCQ